jgi:hypothetical protein
MNNYRQHFSVVAMGSREQGAEIGGLADSLCLSGELRCHPG